MLPNSWILEARILSRSKADLLVSLVVRSWIKCEGRSQIGFCTEVGAEMLDFEFGLEAESTYMNGNSFKEIRLLEHACQSSK